ncbi:MAG: hypothetical protein R3E53_10665 [Myxococcota bacterium]
MAEGYEQDPAPRGRGVGARGDAVEERSASTSDRMIEGRSALARGLDLEGRNALGGGIELEGRNALARGLGVEGRNALARVALAASELDRFDVPPGARERVASIRDAVGELDGVLARLDRLNGIPEIRVERHRVPLDAVWLALCERLEAAIAARGLRLGPLAGDGSLVVAMPRSALEALLCAAIRIVSGASSGSAAIVGAAEGRGDRLRLELGATDDAGRSRPLRLDRSDRAELELPLAEWGGRLVAGDPTAGVVLELQRDAGDGHG